MSSFVWIVIHQPCTSPASLWRLGPTTHIVVLYAPGVSDRRRLSCAPVFPLAPLDAQTIRTSLRWLDFDTPASLSVASPALLSRLTFWFPLPHVTLVLTVTLGRSIPSFSLICHTALCAFVINCAVVMYGVSVFFIFFMFILCRFSRPRWSPTVRCPVNLQRFITYCIYFEIANFDW